MVRSSDLRMSEPYVNPSSLFWRVIFEEFNLSPPPKLLFFAKNYRKINILGNLPPLQHFQNFLYPASLMLNQPKVCNIMVNVIHFWE